MAASRQPYTPGTSVCLHVKCCRQKVLQKVNKGMAGGVPQLLRGAGAVLLQREVPEGVNIEAARIAAAAGVPVILDCGGVEGPISEELLRDVAVLSPNETELARLTGALKP